METILRTAVLRRKNRADLRGGVLHRVVDDDVLILLGGKAFLTRDGKAALGDFAHAEKMRSGVEGELLPVMCRDMLSALGMRLAAERMREYLQGYQSVCPLTHAELALFPAVLRSQLLSALAEHCRKLSSSSSPDALTDGFAALFSSLRAMAELDQRAFLRSADLAEAELMADPAGVYPRMDDESRKNREEALRQRRVLSENMANLSESMTRAILYRDGNGEKA